MIDYLMRGHDFLAGTLNTGKPIKEPKTYRACQIKNGFAYFGL
jgi:hypothetical protein